jgi:cytochrome bd-type quinol oxidase subunit 2
MQTKWAQTLHFLPEKNWRFTMFLSGYVIAFVIGVAVGFVFSTVILFRDKLSQFP